LNANDEPLIRSRYVTYFQRHGELFLYHDRFGFLMGMSADVAQFLEWHKDAPRTRTQRLEHFGGQFTAEQIDEFASIFRVHRCLVEDQDTDLVGAWSMVPVRSRWVVTHAPDRDTLVFWNTDGQGHTGPDPQPAWAARLWWRIDGETTLSALYKALEGDPALEAEPDPKRAFAERVMGWVHHDRQYAKMSFAPLSRYGAAHRQPPYLRSTMRYQTWDPTSSPPEPVLEAIGTPVAPPTEYYAHEVSDAQAQFREVETTLSHLFRFPHVALRNNSYAQALAQALEKVAYLGGNTHSIVEVGGGLGHVGAGLLTAAFARWPELRGTLRYTIVDPAPALREAQQTTFREAGLGALMDSGQIRWIDGVAAALPVGDSSVDLLVSNEVIGDLTTIRLRASDVENSGVDLGPYAQRIREWGIEFPDAPPEFYVNVGALEFMAEIQRVLRPRGAAVLTEYGDVHRYPIASTQLDHLEFSVHFAPLLQAAHALGLEPHLHYLQDILGIDRDVETLTSTRTYFTSLRALFASLGRELDKRAYTQTELALLLGSDEALEAIGDLRFEHVDQRVMGLAPHEFRALLLRKPDPADGPAEL
jgi:ubiquinone/menaquinone biosynthesis C-methylase UbiE